MTPELSGQSISINRIVRYVLSEADCAQIMRRRTDGASIAARIKEKVWPTGAQAHIGNPVKAGDIFPAMVVSTSRCAPEGEPILANLQVFLDGCDVFWAVNRENDGDKSPGTWHWPPRVG